jgi:FkbM family methyltransferase
MSRKVEYLKHRLVCSPFGGALDAARGAVRRLRALKRPELGRLLREDAAIAQMLRKLVGPDTNCVDCGCHLGSVMSEFHRLAPRGKHVGVEAIPHKAAWLRARFPRATIHQCAVGERTGEVTFHLDEEASARSSMHKNEGLGSRVTPLVVPLRTLDDLLGVGSQIGGVGDSPTASPSAPQVGLLKVDVEGAEIFALRGARQLIARDRPPVFFECAPSTLKPFGVTTFDVFDEFVSMGYVLVMIDEWIVQGASTKALAREAFDKAQHYPAQARNFLALPKERLQAG